MIVVLPDLLEEVYQERLFYLIRHAKSLLLHKWLLSLERGLDLPEQLLRMRIAVHSDLSVHICRKRKRVPLLLASICLLVLLWIRKRIMANHKSFVFEKTIKDRQCNPPAMGIDTFH